VQNNDEHSSRREAKPSIDQGPPPPNPNNNSFAGYKRPASTPDFQAENSPRRMPLLLGELVGWLNEPNRGYIFDGNKNDRRSAFRRESHA
jgi:hypothetical protein